MEGLKDDARRALEQAVEFSLERQQPDGHWIAPVSADVSFTAEYVMFKYAMKGLSLDEDGDALRRWILATQNDDGSWTLAPDLAGNVSSSVEAYLALRLLDVPATDPTMQRARSFILSQGGVARVRFFTRFFLATFGLIPWAAVPQMPATIILLPTWAPLNIYVLSHWARSTLIPLCLVRHHEPVYPLPNGHSADNDFLDELWCDPTDKMVPYAPPLSTLFRGKDRDALKFMFTLVDKLLAGLDGLRKTWIHKIAFQRCLDWILEHQEEQGDWAGYFPPIHGNVWVMLLEGYPLNHRRVRLGLEALERFSSHDANGKWFQPTVSPCWDTTLMANALCDAGLSGEKSVARAAQWLWDRQLMVDHGDWRIYANTQQAGGWSFEYYNTFFPDVDDTAVVIMTLVKQHPGCIESERIANAVEWVLGMQNSNGGWGAFDINNEACWLHAVPFNDTDALVDPATADVTGRILECFALLLAHRKGGFRLPQPFRHRLHVSAQRALRFLLKEQEESGAWWGRWGSNYIYGTTNVLRGLEGFCHANPDVQRAVVGGIRWLKGAQQPDGGWGETLFSYMDPSLAGCGATTAAQSAWAIDCLLRFGSPSDPAVKRGVRWLVLNQNPKFMDGQSASWPTNIYVGTGFPKVMFVGYPLYHHFFPIAALARYIDNSAHQDAKSIEALELAPHILPVLQSSSILVMILGNHGNIESFLRIARRLHGCRVRVATHPAHRADVERHGFEFYEVFRSQTQLELSLQGKPDNWLYLVPREPAKLMRLFRFAFERFWQASIDGSDAMGVRAITDGAKLLKKEKSDRPFLADIVLSGPAARVNVYAAERLQAPLVLVLPRAKVPFRESSHLHTVIQPNKPPQWLWNHTSPIIFDLLHWMAFGLFLTDCRAREYGKRPIAWLWTLQRLFSGRYQHLCAQMVFQVSVEGDGANAAAKTIATNLSAPEMNTACSLIPALQAHWLHKESVLPLSGAAAAGLVSRGILSWEDLDLRPRIGKVQAHPAPPAEIQLLSKVAEVTGLILVTLHSVLIRLLGLFGTSAAEESGRAITWRDPVRQARIRQGGFDLDFIRRHVDEKEATTVEDRLVRRWRALAVAEFRKQFY